MGFYGNLKAASEYNSYKEDINDAYFKIEGVFIDTQKKRVRVPVRGWLSEYARQNSGIGIFKRVFYIPIEEFGQVLCQEDAIIEKAYEYIKALPEFADAKDAMAKYTGKIDFTKDDVDKQADSLEELIEKIKG